jgi:hypothetical protein
LARGHYFKPRRNQTAINKAELGAHKTAELQADITMIQAGKTAKFPVLKNKIAKVIWKTLQLWFHLPQVANLMLDQGRIEDTGSFRLVRFYTPNAMGALNRETLVSSDLHTSGAS